VRVPEAIQAFMQTGRVGRLATVAASGAPHVVPVCYAYDRAQRYSVIDAKPKRVERERLQRLANIRRDPRVCLLIDDYDEDWDRLRFVMIHGTARIALEGPEHAYALDLLRKKYPQYRAMPMRERVNPVIVMTPATIVSWGRFD